MTRLVAFCIACFVAGGAFAANLGGKVSFVSKRGQSPTINETLVWLEPGTSKVKPPPAGTFQVLTRSKTLVPHVIAIPVGSTVDFPNDDPISHNLFSLSPASSFDLGLYRKGPGKSRKFDQPGVVNVYCNVHPNMSAVIHVMATPYYTFADPQGVFGFRDVPAGKYKLIAWNEQGGQTEVPITVDASGNIASNGRTEGNVIVTLDSRTYRAMQHTNKEGKAYTNPRTRDY